MSLVTNLNELQGQIRDQYSDLSKRLQQVAEYVIENTESVAFDTVAVIAQRADVPPSTLIRFANHFGFNGFNEMKQLFRQNIIERTSNVTSRTTQLNDTDGKKVGVTDPESILQTFCEANSLAMEHLASQTSTVLMEQAVDLLDEADHIYLVGMQRSFIVAYYLAYALRHLDRRIILIDGFGGMSREQISQAKSSDVVVLASFSPYTQETVELGRIASAAGAKTIVLSDTELNPLGTFSDVCFVVKEPKIREFRLQTASLCLAQTLTVSLAYKQEQRLKEQAESKSETA